MSLIRPIAMNISSVVKPRYAPYFDGLTQYGVFAERAIDVEGDIDVEFWTPDSVSVGSQQVILGQSLSTSQSEKEFEIFISAGTGNLGLTIGGKSIAVALAGSYYPSTKYRVMYSGTTLETYENGQLIRSISFTRGLEREPLAQTFIATRAGSPSTFYKGVMPGIKINGTQWLLNKRNNQSQSSVPTGNDLTIINHTEAMWRKV